jgi:hypothetical protein
MAPGSVENQISGSCSTGECTFPDTEQETTDPKYDRSDNPSTHSTIGICNRCVDIASLVSRVECEPDLCFEQQKVQYTLPTGLNIIESAHSASAFAKIHPTSDLQWLGDLLTLELRAMSKWAYVNDAFLASKTENDVKAAVCVLYPCLRTYAALIKNNSLIEREVTSQVMLLESEEVGSDMMRYQWANAQLDGYYRYTAIRSPCRVDNRVYDLTL